MSELSLQELDAQFSELLPEREALGCFGKLNLPCHDYNPCQPHHHHCEPKPCEPKPCEPKPCHPAPPQHQVPCDNKPWDGGGKPWDGGGKPWDGGGKPWDQTPV